MSLRIVYQTEDGGVAIIVPSPEALSAYGIINIALKDVPAGKPFKIIDAADVPEDRTFRSAWEIDPGILTDGIGGSSSDFENNS